MQFFYILYQYFIVVPIWILITIFTAVITIICFPFKNSEFIHKIQQIWSRSLFWLLFIKVTVHGEENIPKGESFVFVSNHSSSTDILAIYGYLPVVFKWIMKKELRYVPFIGTACAAAGHIFINRKGLHSSINGIKKAEKVLKDGISIVIFPEGTRAKDGVMKPFKRGATQMAFDLKKRVIPIALDGCYEIMPKDHPHCHHHDLHVCIGQPIDLQEYMPDRQQEALTMLYNEVARLKKEHQ